MTVSAYYSSYMQMYFVYMIDVQASMRQSRIEVTVSYYRIVLLRLSEGRAIVRFLGQWLDFVNEIKKTQLGITAFNTIPFNLSEIRFCVLGVPFI